MTEEQLVRFEKALVRLEAYLTRCEKIGSVKTSSKKVFDYDMDVVNKAFDKGMKQALKNLEKLETSLEISKENKNTLTVTDDLIKDKYTKSTKESIEAFTKSRAIKLKNKHIKKGSLRITQA